MTADQYKTIIKWTADQIGTKHSINPLWIVAASLRNMGLYIPTGSYEQIMQILSTNTYMNWRSCTADEAQKLANKGRTVICMNASSAFIILPEDEQRTHAAVPYASTIMNIPTEERQTMRFYAYISKDLYDE